MKKEELVNEIIKIDADLRAMTKIPLFRVRYSVLKKLHHSTLRSVHLWYQRIFESPEYTEFMKIKRENTEEFWKRARGSSLPEVKHYRECKYNLQQMCQKTVNPALNPPKRPKPIEA